MSKISAVQPGPKWDSPHPDEKAFLDAILASPLDDEPRLIYADCD